MMTRMGRGTLRTLRRDPGFTLPTLLILGLGIGATVAVATVARGILLSPLPYPDADRLVSLCERHDSLEGLCIGSVPTIQDLADRSASVAAAGTARSWSYTLSDGQGRHAVGAGIATPGYFQALGVEASLGRLFAPEEVGADADGVVVLTHAFWQERYGGDPAVIGSTLVLDDEAVEVIGVLPAGTRIPFLDRARLWRPVHVHPSDSERREWRGFRTLARLAPGATLDQASAEAGRLYRSLGERHAAIGEDWDLEVVSLRELVVGEVRPSLLAFLAGSLLLLVVACANVANLVLTRSARLRRDLAIRASLGADSQELLGGVVAESATLALGAAALGSLGAWAGTRALLAMAPPGIPRLEAVRPDLWILAWAVVTAAVCVALAGVLPALRSRRSDLASTLRAVDAHGPGARSRGRTVLAVMEVALAVVLTFGSVLFARSLAGFLAWEPGFETEEVLTTWVLGSSERFTSREDVPAYWRALEAEVSALPGVRSVATVSSVPLAGGLETSEYRTRQTVGLRDDALPSARWFDVGPGYFATLGLRLVRGREIRESDDGRGPGVVVVNETFARAAWPGGEPLGEWVEPLFAEAQGRLEVVGVVADVPPLTPGVPTAPALYWSNRQFGRPASYLAIRFSGDPGAVSTAVRERVEAFDPGAGLTSLRTIADLVEPPLAQPRFAALVAGVFAGTALILAGIGLYGVLAYAVARRTRAIGIQLALGATPGRVTRRVVGKGLGVTGAGLALGLAGGVAVGRVVAELVPGASAGDPVLLASTGFVALLLAVAAAARPAWRAGRVDPVRLLRES